jgi:hypothetical protein
VAGIAGMFLAIPILAILKIIFDRIESLEAWGYLMGDNLPKNFIWKKKSPLVPEKQSEMGQVKITVSDDDFTEPISESNTTKNSNFSLNIDNTTP